MRNKLASLFKHGQLRRTMLGLSVVASLLVVQATLAQTTLTLSNGYTLNVSSGFTLSADSLVLQSGSTTSLAGTSTVSVSGNVSSSGTVSVATPSLVKFTAATPQTVSGIPTLSNLTVSGGGTLTLNSPLTLTDTLTLTNGTVVTTNLLTTRKAVGGSVTAFVNGPLAISGSGDKVFPIGKATAYRPVKITATTNTSQVEVFNGNANGTPSGVVRLSTVRYWQASGGVTSGTSTIELAYDTAADFVTNPATLVVASSPTVSGTYLSRGQSALNTTFSPSIVSSPLGLGNLEVFTLGSAAFVDNPLPVELSAFEAVAVSHGLTLASSVRLKWVTQSETNNLGFELYRYEKGGQTIEKIAGYQTNSALKGLGSSPSGKMYLYTDGSAKAGVTYIYRLMNIDYAGRTAYHETGDVVTGKANCYALGQNYPNPFNPETVINYQLASAGEVSLRVYDVLGREVMRLVEARQEAGMHSVVLNGSKLASGIYFYRLTAGKFAATKKLLLVK